MCVACSEECVVCMYVCMCVECGKVCLAFMCSVCEMWRSICTMYV